jgi:DMSO reductase anchor subunit
MRPHPSLLFFTVLAGAGQGFFVALFAVEAMSRDALPAQVLATGAWTVLGLLAAGLVASVFHLGRPSRAWRAASQWRTSWLSREVIVLPALMGLVFAHAMLLQAGESAASLPLHVTGALGAIACVLLWWCTGMIYACLRMVQAWATAWTPIALAAMGLASGTLLAAAWFAGEASAAHSGAGAASTLTVLVDAAAMLTLLAASVKVIWWQRSARLAPKSTLQSALAIPRPNIRQIAMGMTGGSFNTREFFHGRSAATMRRLPWAMGVLGVALPLALCAVAWRDVALATTAGLADATACLAVAAVLQLAGLFVERWLFFAVAQHPQNLYYQRAS